MGNTGLDDRRVGFVARWSDTTVVPRPPVLTHNDILPDKLLRRIAQQRGHPTTQRVSSDPDLEGCRWRL